MAKSVGRPRKTKPAWTWSDVPAEWRPPQYRGSTLQRAPGQVTAHPSSVEQLEPVREPDSLMRELCDLMTPLDAGRIVAEKAACLSTIDRWRNGLCFAPRIDTLRRVANVMNMDIGLIKRQATLTVHHGGKRTA
jgi:hypothetical protein